MKSVLVLILVVFISGCGSSPTINPGNERAFYFWKTSFKLNDTELAGLRNHHVKKLYIKLFDVVNDPASDLPMPVAKVTIDANSLGALAKDSVTLVPVIFITNETFTKTDSVGARLLAAKIAKLIGDIVKDINPRAHLRNEIQFDCDWTASTKNRYFEFLNEFRRLSIQTSPLISATIRLYQCKYLLRTGVPPVDRGLLMCYNMGNLRDPSNTGNSIFDLAEMEKYTTSLSSYPLELDIALPLFDWTVLIRNNSFAGLLQQLPPSLFSNAELTSANGNIYTVLKDTVIVGYSLKQHDKLRLEETRYNEIVRAGALLSKRLGTKQFTISLYHLDSTILTKYSNNELENIYNSIH